MRTVILIIRGSDLYSLIIFVDKRCTAVTSSGRLQTGQIRLEPLLTVQTDQPNTFPAIKTSGDDQPSHLVTGEQLKVGANTSIQ